MLDPPSEIGLNEHEKEMGLTIQPAATSLPWCRKIATHVDVLGGSNLRPVLVGHNASPERIQRWR